MAEPQPTKIEQATFVQKLAKRRTKRASKLKERHNMRFVHSALRLGAVAEAAATENHRSGRASMAPSPLEGGQPDDAEFEGAELVHRMAPVEEAKDDEDHSVVESMESSALRTALRMVGGGAMTERVFRIPLCYWYQVTSTAGGVIPTYVNNDPSVGVGWSSAAGLFNQYRVREVHVTYSPMYNVVQTGSVFQMTFSFIDEDDATTVPSSLSASAAHADTLRVHSGYETWTRASRPVNREATNPDDTWNDTAAPAAGTQAIKICGLCGLFSTVVANVLVKWDIEFRGLGS